MSSVSPATGAEEGVSRSRRLAALSELVLVVLEPSGRVGGDLSDSGKGSLTRPAVNRPEGSWRCDRAISGTKGVDDLRFRLGEGACGSSVWR